MRPVFLAILFFAGSVSLAAPKKPPKTYSIPLPAKADFSSLDWLVGEWAGKTTDKSPQGEVHLSVAYDLDQRFIIFREKVALAATDTTPAVNESWMGVLSGRGTGNDFILRAFSSTGFITRYRVTVNQAEIHFTPEGGEQPPPGWLFRRVVMRTGVGELTETVQAAPPDGSFFDYYVAQLTHPAAPPSAAAAGGSEKQR